MSKQAYNTTPLFSIVIPTYNHGHLIGRCLDSIVGQIYSNWEAIVVNNFSQDNTIEVVKSYNDPRIRLVNFANNGVIGASRNRGIQEARGEWICFLDSDDWWTQDKLSTCLKYIGDADFLYHDMRIVRENKTNTWGKKNRLCGRKLGKKAFENMLLNGNPIVNSSVVIRREWVDRLGPISEDRELIAVEDFDYWLRAARQGIRMVYIPKVKGKYWVGGNNVSVSIRQFWRFSAVMKKNLSGCDDRFVRRVERRMLFVQGRILHVAGYPRRARVFYRAAWNGGYGYKAVIGCLLLQIGH